MKFYALTSFYCLGALTLGFSAGWTLRSPLIPDSTIVETNGTVAVIINGHRKVLAYDATNMVVRTKRGARITTEFKP